MTQGIQNWPVFNSYSHLPYLISVNSSCLKIFISSKFLTMNKKYQISSSTTEKEEAKIIFACQSLILSSLNIVHIIRNSHHLHQLQSSLIPCSSTVNFLSFSYFLIYLFMRSTQLNFISSTRLALMCSLIQRLDDFSWEEYK